MNEIDQISSSTQSAWKLEGTILEESIRYYAAFDWDSTIELNALSTGVAYSTPSQEQLDTLLDLIGIVD